MTDSRQNKENVKNQLKDLRQDLKKMHLAVTEELLMPQPDEVKKLMNIYLNLNFQVKSLKDYQK